MTTSTPCASDGESKSRLTSKVVRFLDSPKHSRSAPPPRSRPRSRHCAVRAPEGSNPGATRSHPGMERDVRVALFEVRDATHAERALSLLESLQRTHFHDGVWWRTESRRAHASASDVAWMSDACVDASKRPAMSRGPTRLVHSRATCSTTTGTVTCHLALPPRRQRNLLAQQSRHRSTRATQGDLRRRDAVESRRRVSRARAIGPVHG